MSDAVWIGFILASVLAFGIFFFKARHFDFLAIAYVGALFYFSPLFWGRVLQSSPNLDSTIPPAVYLIATAYVLALALAGIISASPSPAPVPKIAPPLSGWYFILALIGLVGAFVASKGAILNADKVQALKQIGYLYVLFQIAASLTCISAVIERSRWTLVGGAFLLVIDLLVGFRVFFVLTALSVALVMLMRDGRIRLFTKIPTFGPAALLLVVAMLLVHTARFAIFDRLAVMENSPRTQSTQEMRGDILQLERTAGPQKTGDQPSNPSAGIGNAVGAVSRWAQIPLGLLERSEPSIIQATLVGIVQRNVSCNPSNIFKSLYLLLPPGTARFFPNTFPPTFYDEYQPILYPDVTYGTGGNIWAEMLCRFGYVGAAIFGTLLILTLTGLYWLLRRASRAAAAPMAFGGIVIAFYIGRNDLHFTLVMLRQIAIVFGGAYALSAIAARIRGIKPWT